VPFFQDEDGDTQSEANDGKKKCGLRQPQPTGDINRMRNAKRVTSDKGEQKNRNFPLKNMSRATGANKNRIFLLKKS